VICLAGPSTHYHLHCSASLAWHQCCYPAAVNSWRQLQQAQAAAGPGASSRCSSWGYWAPGACCSPSSASCCWAIAAPAAATGVHGRHTQEQQQQQAAEGPARIHRMQHQQQPPWCGTWCALPAAASR
jgi:hypothetical protein